MNWFTFLIKHIFDGKSPDVIGEIGEWKLARYLNTLPPTYHVIRDVYLPSGNDMTTQVDAVVVSKYGIFVIEAKNFDGDGTKGGWVFGDAKSKQWCISTRGRRKFLFQNPIRQNYKHVAVLSELTGIPQDRFYNVVVFVGWAEFKTGMPDGVIYGTKLTSHIQKCQRQIIKESQVADVASVIRQWAGTVTDAMRNSHVMNLKLAHDSSAYETTPSCPRCGEKMLLRHRRNDGGAFYGCSQFPKCRGITPV